MIITLFIQLELYQFKTLFSKTMEEFGLENHFDDFKKIDEDLKKTLKWCIESLWISSKVLRVDSDKELVREWFFTKKNIQNQKFYLHYIRFLYLLFMVKRPQLIMFLTNSCIERLTCGLESFDYFYYLFSYFLFERFWKICCETFPFLLHSLCCEIRTVFYFKLQMIVERWMYLTA